MARWSGAFVCSRRRRSRRARAPQWYPDRRTRRPVERLVDAGNLGNHGHRIAGPRVGEPHREAAPANAFDRLDDLEHGVAVAVAAIEGFAGAILRR